jgi:predicted MFS family arabinose efflux permease
MSSLDVPASRAAKRAALGEPSLTRGLVLLFAASCGIIATNVFANQPLIALIGSSLGLDPAAMGLVSMLTLLGYAAGLFLLVPLADLMENRSLVLRMLACASLFAAATAAAPAPGLLLAASFGLGMASSVIQILVPLAAGMAPEHQRGRVVGEVMSGVMLGIVLSRPLASLIADSFGWRAFYAVSTVATAGLALILFGLLPSRKPPVRARYAALILSLVTLFREEAVLRRRAFTSALAMASFTVFWTVIALELAAQPFGLGQRGIAVFALVGAMGAFAAPVAGRIGDRGFARAALAFGHVAIAAGCLLAMLAPCLEASLADLRLPLMAVAAVLLDIGVTTDQTLGRRAVQLLRPEARGRLNGMFVGLFFVGGALGSLLSGVAWAQGGWTLSCAIGAAFGVIALLVDVFGGRD